MKNILPFFVFMLLVSNLHAVEQWADEKLPVKDGLALWLDAGAESRALAAEGAKVETGRILPGIWHDASGNKRNARQEKAPAHPRFDADNPAKFFSFDGNSQHFAVKSAGLKMREATVIVFARARSNTGGYRALLAANKSGANDYVSGFNIDFGSQASDDGLGGINVEGAGFPGEQNLLREPLALGAPFVLTARFLQQEVKIAVSDTENPGRPRAKDSVIHSDEFIIGGRIYNNSGPSPMPQGFFHGDIFEVLVYERALSSHEVRAIRSYAAAKYAGVPAVAVAKPAQKEGAAPLVTVKDPPIIHPLVPGFTTRKLPVSLPNINFLRYHADGRLFAGAYNGKIYVLRDTDGDGVEDKAEIFYESKEINAVMGMALTPPNYALGEGVFIAARGRILLILDKDHDGKGDEIITVAEGWEKPAIMTGGVSDALGVALGKDGSVYFNLGTSAFTNGYLLDAAGNAKYRTSGERGTIQRVSPDFKTRETVCTGVRFTVGLAFNSLGDLFATEQEGATWLANGNPLDELLHIQTGRHYGFPPRHPKHLPDVVDEPSIFDYSPQHQSTVGLCFNEPLKDGAPGFGPAWWRGDALVAAMSRGKVYRTKLVKTDAGYVAKNETFAQLQRIIIDQAVSPGGALTVTLHSGAPDWGTGPTGTGELWQIVPKKDPAPQPVLAWSETPEELRVSFDAPIDAAAFAAMRDRVHVVQGRYVQAGDRFETMRPGYQVVKDQLATPRYPVAVQKLMLADAGRTLVIATPPRSAAVCYGINIEADAFKAGGDERYSGQIDLLAELTGLEAEFQPANGRVVKSWLPHPDTAVSRTLTEASAGQRAFFETLAKPGAIMLRGQFDLSHMLQPEIQPGAKLDWDYPPEQVTVVFEAARPFQFSLGDKTVSSEQKGARHTAAQTVTSKQGLWLAFAIAVASGSGDPALTCHWFTDRSATQRAFPLRRILLPYARQQDLPTMPRNDELPQLAGANWHNGKAVFQKSCAVCHTMRGEGGHVGPDMSNLIFRDYDSVARDIREPSAAINPEHLAYTVKKKDGIVLSAIVVGETAKTVSFGDATGKVVEIPRDEIAVMKPLSISLMPEGLDKALAPEQLRDLMSYLLLPPLEPAPLMVEGAPPPRKRAEVENILGAALTAPPDPKAKQLRILLCASEKDAGHNRPGYHDYPIWRTRWSRLLRGAERITVETADTWPSLEQWERCDIVVFNSYNPAWAGEKDRIKLDLRAASLDSFLARGGGLVFIHFALNAGANAEALSARLGLAWGNGSKFRHGASDWVLDKKHPLAAGFDRFQIPDESYWNLTGDLAAANGQVLATSLEDNEPRPQMWTREAGPGRVFVSIPGHYTWTYDDPLFRILIFRGMMWSARQPLDRLAPLVPVGARMEQ